MYKNSGETMFGLDRKAGSIETIKPEGVEFFKIIDDDKKKLGMAEFCKKWKYNYRGGDKEDILKTAREHIEVIRLYMRALFDMKQINLKQFVQVNQHVEDISKQYSCWQKVSKR